MKQEQVLATYLGPIVGALATAGVKHVVVSPGSRSTPLALLLAHHKQIKVWLHVDERSAAFMALGMAKASQEPVALLCSSGTAVANYLPAVAEAKHSRTPLIILTADRPHELRDVGAPQTMEQNHIFSSFVKWFCELAEPAPLQELTAYGIAAAARAVATAVSSPAGPVHLNFPLREPLLPDLALAESLWNENNRNIGVKSGKQCIAAAEAAKLMEELMKQPQGIIVCGPSEAEDATFAKAVTTLAETLGYPLLVDPLSQLRSGSHNKMMLIETYDAFLRDIAVAETLRPEVILRFGALPVSKSLFQFLKKHSSVRQILVDATETWRDPALTATEVFYSDSSEFCRSLLSHQVEFQSKQVTLQASLDRASAARTRSATLWQKKWLSMNKAVRAVITEATEPGAMAEAIMAKGDPVGSSYRSLLSALPAAATIVVGNSMPIRDLDTFFLTQEPKLCVIGNRGVNGIDGLTSTALGAAVFSQPCVLVVGDLSFFHDLNGLLAAKLHEISLTVILINNDGGGIFSFLPQANLPEHFEELFGTPLGLDFSAVVAMYGGSFIRLKEEKSLQDCLARVLPLPGLKVIEVESDRSDNVVWHKQLW
ncbi:MAG: 2-succinyl-5-enolpyruvyl-6-hydroxy-3-cyclohexene-1-carboxylic-acid synthase, partial [Sporomusaceae bacterium]|nr:2-succinyl-5-enolpyruvyl-6-hydroxy-3-cyclohexene-1-carboxylic-acid synthase [Sporomusaceae bacterium]